MFAPFGRSEKCVARSCVRVINWRIWQTPPDTPNTEGGGGGKEEKKNRLSSTTCGEELKKIGKDWQSFKGLYKKYQKITNFGRFKFLTFFDL